MGSPHVQIEVGFCGRQCHDAHRFAFFLAYILYRVSLMEILGG